MKKLSKYSVVVGKGSGCLYKTASPDYDYVLTARHNFNDNEELKSVIRQYINEADELVSEELKIIGTPFFHNDLNRDAAIIKIENVDNLDSISRLMDNDVNDRLCILFGHPSVRSKDKFSYREDTLTIKNTKQYGYIECELSTSHTYAEVLGQSGGGIVKQYNDKYYLVGIQSRMSSKDEEELLSRIDIMPMYFYDEIIDNYGKELERISLSFFECFSNLKEQVMSLHGAFVDSHVKFTRNHLRSITDRVVKSKLTPSYIKNFFNERLLIYGQHNKHLNNKKLWLAWLEFLIIMNIYKDGVIDDSNIEDIFNSHRLIFSNTEKDWSSELQNILRSDFLGLKEDSKIIISTNSTPTVSVIEANYLDDIMRDTAITRSDIMIDEAGEYPLKGHNLIHLNAFQTNCIVSKAIEYKDYIAMQEDQLTLKLKLEYDRLFN